MGSNASFGFVNEAFHGSGDMRHSETEYIVERPNEVQEVIVQEHNRKSHHLFPVSKIPPIMP